MTWTLEVLIEREPSMISIESYEYLVAQAYDLVSEEERLQLDQLSENLIARGQRLQDWLWSIDHQLAGVRTYLVAAAQMRREILRVSDRIDRVIQRAKK